jgi:hypothetical protein
VYETFQVVHINLFEIDSLKMYMTFNALHYPHLLHASMILKSRLELLWVDISMHAMLQKNFSFSSENPLI